MAFPTVPFALQNASHSAALFRQAVASLVPAGGGLCSPTDLTITQTGTPSMAVTIGVGRCWIPGTQISNVVGGQFSTQAMYYTENESAVTATVAPSNASNPRIDMVYVAVQDSQYSGASNQISPTFIVTGPPASGASWPTNAPAIPNNAIALGYITVRAASPSILNSDITIFPQPVVGGFAATKKTMFNNAGMTNQTGTASRLLADLSLASTTYDRIMNVTAQVGVTAASIASGVQNVYLATSLMSSTVGGAQGLSALAWTAPGNYIESGYVTTGDILVPAGTTPLARAWIQVLTGSVSTTVTATAALSQIWCTETPTSL